MKSKHAIVLAVAALLLASQAPALDVTLSAVQFPEQRTIEIEFAPTSHAPKAEVVAKVEARAAQTQVDISFSKMRPAVLFAGDITSYVVWAVSRDGAYENLGELWVRDASDTVAFSTGLKEFGLLITAEPHAMVDDPSDLVVFTGRAPKDAKGSRVTPFQFSRFVPAAKYGVESVANIEYTGETPLDLLQAQKAYELAQRAESEKYAAGLMREARVALAQATTLATSGSRKKEMVDFSRRTVSLSSEAMRVTKRRLEEQELERRIAQRKAEMDALEARARTAETSAATAQADLQRASAQKAAIEADMARLQREKATLEAQKVELEQRTAALQKERETLSARLQGALSQVAETKNTARGFIVNLPDILFDVNQATLKPEAKITIAKLSGILLLMPELNLRIEGHTDSTGSAEYNMTLSQRRAESVLSFLAESGIAATRMQAFGYGLERPIADNATKEGRAKNRRVELVIAEGQVQAAQ